MSVWTKTAASVFAGHNADGTARQISTADAARWGGEVEAYLSDASPTVPFPETGFPAVLQGKGPWKLSKFKSGAGVGNETADTAALENAIASGEKALDIDPVQFNIAAANYAIPEGTTLKGQGKASVLYCADTALNVALLRVANDVRLANFVMRGPQDTVSTYVAGQHGIDTGDTGADIQNVRLRDLEIYGFAAYGVTGHRYKGLRSQNNTIHDVGRAGWLMVGGDDCVHVGDTVKTVGPGSGGTAPLTNAYGFQYGNDGASVGFPRPSNISFIDCGVEDLPSWTGFDCHAVRALELINCWTFEVCNPIYLGPSSGTNDDPGTEGLVLGGRFVAGGLTYTRAGLIIAKATADLGGDGTRIIGPYFEGHGLNQALYDLNSTVGITDEGCVHVVYSKGVTLSDITVRDWHQSAFNFRREVENTTLRGHNIGDGNSVNSIMQAIRVAEAQNTDVLIERGTIKRTSGGMTGIHAGGTTPSGIYGPKVHRQDLIGVPTPISSGSFALLHEDSTFEISGSVTSNLGNVAAGAALQLAITVTGAAFGDKVVHAYKLLNNGLVCRNGHVSAADTVTIEVWNPTTSDIDPAQDTYTAIVTKRGKR